MSGWRGLASHYLPRLNLACSLARVVAFAAPLLADGPSAVVAFPTDGFSGVSMPCFEGPFDYLGEFPQIGACPHRTHRRQVTQ